MRTQGIGGKKDASIMLRWIVKRLGIGTTALLSLAGVGAASPLCPGDCNLDRHVTNNEVVSAINIALGYAAPGACWDADVDEDGEITIVDLLTSVATINRDCGPPPEYRFQVSEQIDFTGPHLVLSVATVEDFSCGGYRIDGAVRVQDDSIDLTLGSVVPPSGFCAAVIAPAGFSQQLDLQQGEYVFTIRSRSRIDVYHLTISADLITLTPSDASFSEPWYLYQHRFPS